MSTADASMVVATVASVESSTGAELWTWTDCWVPATAMAALSVVTLPIWTEAWDCQEAKPDEETSTR